MSKLAKFFIICAAVCVLGIVMTFAGYAAGGFDNMGKVAEKHDWLNVGPNSTETNIINVGEFTSIEAEGSLDIAVLSTGQMPGEAEIPDFLEDVYAEGVAGTVAVNWGKGSDMPEVKNEEGVLKIKGSSEPIGSGVVNLNGEDPNPDVVIFCSTEQLESISINNIYGDVAVEGIKAKKIDITTDSGDTNISYVSGDELTVNTDSGDIELEEVMISKQNLMTYTGDIDIKEGRGEINAKADSGCIEFESALTQKEFEVSMSTEAGDLAFNDGWLEVKEFITGNGPNKLMFETLSGDIDVEFDEN